MIGILGPSCCAHCLHSLANGRCPTRMVRVEVVRGKGENLSGVFLRDLPPCTCRPPPPVPPHPLTPHHHPRPTLSPKSSKRVDLRLPPQILQLQGLLSLPFSCFPESHPLAFSELHVPILLSLFSAHSSEKQGREKKKSKELQQGPPKLQQVLTHIHIAKSIIYVAPLFSFTTTVSCESWGVSTH